MSAPTPVALSSLGDFPLPSLDGADDKEARGRVLVVAGSAQVPGAPILSGLAALRAGAGKLQLVAARPAALALGLAVPEAAVIAVAANGDGDMVPEAAAELQHLIEDADAVVVGPGMASEPGSGELAARLMLASAGPAFVADAAALTELDLNGGAAQSLGGRLVVTPHAGEMAKLLDRSKEDVLADPCEAARVLAARLKGVVVMKGAETFIVSPDGRAWSHAGGVIGLGTSGSGDVLAGVIGGLLARGAAPLTAALWGVCLHAAAGARLSDRRGRVGLLARELPAEIPALLDEAAAASARAANLG